MPLSKKGFETPFSSYLLTSMDHLEKKEGSLFGRIIGISLLLFAFLLGYQLYSAWKNPYEYAREVYFTVKSAVKVFPEGKSFYEYALDSSVKLYQYKTKLERVYGQGSLLKIISDALNGNREALETLKFLLIASFAKWIVLLGVLYGLLSKSFLLFSAALLAVLIFALFRHLKLLEWLKLNLKAFSLAEVKTKDALTAIKVLLANPRPASIAHHRSEEGGLLKHSLEVAKEALRRAKERGLNEKEAYLAGLLHDVGKIKLYAKDERGNWVSTGAKEEVAQSLAMAELKEKFGLEEPQNEEIKRLVKEVDREITAKELWEAFKSLHYDAKKLLEELIPRLRYYYKEGLPFVAVPAKEINPAFTEKLNEIFQTNLPTEVNFESSVHPIAQVHPYRGFVLLKWEGKYSDRLDLFDAVVDGKKVKAVYLFDLSKLNLKLKPNAEKIEVNEREAKEAFA